jgi:TolB-like protein
VPDIFLSYSRDDLATARRFADGFEAAGFTVWWDQTLRSGENYDQVTEGALRAAKAVVVLWSKNSVDSRWVRAEATTADRNGTLVPAMIEPCNRPIMFELKHTAELAHWRGESNDPAWRTFLGDVSQFVGRDETRNMDALPREKPRGDRWPMLAIPVALLALGGAGWWVLHREPGEPTSPPAAVATNAPVPVADVSLAVLPFANLSGDPEQEYFSDGLTEEILNELAQVRELRLIGRTSSFSFKGRNEDLRVIGEKLGVANLLEGSIRKEGQQVRITAQLIDARDGSNRWSKTYERELKGVFALQEEVAKDVAQALSITLDLGQLSRARGGTTNAEAYDLYLQALSLSRQSDFRQAVQKYREALALDPDFRAAWSGLTSAYSGMIPGYPEEEAAIRAGISEAGERIQALAPDSTESLQIRATRLLGEHKWQDAEALLLAAGVSNLSGSGLGNAYGTVLRSVGRVKEAVPYYQQGAVREPLSLVVSGQAQIVLDSAGMPAAAHKEYLRGKSLPGDYSQWDFHAHRRQWMREGVDPAGREREFRAGLAADQVAPQLAATLARDPSNREAALDALRKAFDDPAYQNNARMLRLLIYADYFGDRQLAVAALRRGLVELKGLTTLIPWYPSESGWRSDPAFKELMRDMHVVDYWRATGNWGDFCSPVGEQDFECR